MPAYDVTSDRQFKVLAYLKNKIDFPEFSKEAAVRSNDLNEVPDEWFAWPEKRAFPIDSKANAFLSTVYFLATANDGSHVPNHVYDNLEKAASMFDLNEDISKVASHMRKPRKRTAKASDFGLLYKQAGRTVAKYPLLDAEHVKQAAEHFEANYHNHSVEEQRTIADNILIKAASFGVTITEPAVFKCSGCSAEVDLAKAIDQVEKRAYRNKELPIGKAFEKVASGLRKISSHDLDSVRRFQDLIYQLDKTAGLDRYYGRHYENPLMIMYREDSDMGYLFKEAEEMIELAGYKCPLSTLLGLPPSLYEDILGESIKYELMTGDALDPAKLKAVLPTLPLPEATFLKSQIASLTS